jgi:hypothetical protein
MAWRRGVYIGGTSTDVALVEEETRHIGIAKAACRDLLRHPRRHPLRGAKGGTAGNAHRIQWQHIPEIDWNLQYCPVVLPSRATFVCPSKK